MATVRLLLENNAKVDVGDKYGTTALIWASRNGHEDIVDLLLKKGANCDSVGMYSWTALIVATKGNHANIVDLLLDRSPNINSVDKDGLASLAIASKEGYDDIAFKLLSAGAYTNVQDRAGDTSMIHACKGGHKNIVEALIKKHADVDMKGKENKTALHWAIDKNHQSIVKVLLNANPDLEVRTIEGYDTPLLRAVRGRNAEIVQMLLDKKAKLSASDSKRDTALHIAMRARSKAIVDVLLRNPKHNQLLYRPNRQGETPYSIDVNSQKSIIGQVFGARSINTNEDSENILGYDRYSSALAAILTEPTLSMPITVGLYAKWGSGKSFLLGKLRKEMNFAREWIDPTLRFSVLIFFVLLHIAAVTGVLSWVIAFSCNLGVLSIAVALIVGVLTILLLYASLVGIWKGSYKYDLTVLNNANIFLARQLNSLKLIIQVMFGHPPGPDWAGSLHQAQPIRFLFTDHTKIITSSGGQNSVTQMIGSLLDCIENQYGSFSTRLYRAFQPQSLTNSSAYRWRRLCCIPYIVIYTGCFLASLATIVLACLLAEYQAISDTDLQNSSSTNVTIPYAKGDEVIYQNISSKTKRRIILGLLVITCCVVGITMIANIYTIASCLQALCFSQRKHLQRTVSKLDLVKSEGYLQAVKTEVNLMLDMVKCLDSFTGHQSRLVIVVDGLDSCEQSKVLSVLDAVHMLFSDQGAPFIILLAIDPHVITKAIELNINQVFSETNIGGNVYLKNMVQLPFFLQNAGSRRVKTAQALAAGFRNNKSYGGGGGAAWMETDEGGSSAPQRKLSNESNFLLHGKKKYQPKRARSRLSESAASSVGSNLNKGGLPGPHDFGRVIMSDDYFSDANPKSMRRLMNVLSVMGRLLKAFHIDFNWYHLASWVNITEQWPYRLSWVVYFAERYEGLFDDNASLKSVFEKIRGFIPTQKDMEPLLELDRNEKKLETFLLYHKKNLTMVDLRIFLPFTINLDPYIKKVIKEEIQQMEELGLSMDEILSNAGETSSDILGAGGPPLTRRQAQGLNRISQTEGFLPAKQQQTLMQNYPMMFNPHNQQNYPMWPPWNSQIAPKVAVVGPQNAVAKEPSPSSPAAKASPEIELPTEVSQTPLSQKNVEEVCNVLRTISGITPEKVEPYCSIITSQNLSGTVLYNCNIEDLKEVMNMTFGDWEMFKLILLSLKCQEKRDKVKLTLNNQKQKETSNNPSSLQGISVRDAAKPSATAGSGSSSHYPGFKHQTSVEKQVSMEDAMISGLLSTLNEEAHEDILTEEQESGHSAINDNIIDIISPLSSQIGRSDTIDLGSQASGWQDHSHKIGTASWESSQMDMQGLTSVPTSPTATQLPMTSSQSYYTSPVTVRASERTPSIKVRGRYMRDRLDSLTGSEKEAYRVHPSFDGAKDDDDDPYAWLSSKTAPASPQFGKRRRSKSEGPGKESTLSLTAEDEGPLPAVGRFHPAESFASMEKLNKVKRRFKSAWNAMDHGPIPATQRAKVSNPSSIASSRVQVDATTESQSHAPENPGFFRRLSTRMSSTASSKCRLTQSSSLIQNESRDNEDEDSDSCSSPEQETVSKRPSQNRGPHIQQLFSRDDSAVTSSALSIMTAVLPDGQVVKEEPKSSGGNIA